MPVSQAPPEHLRPPLWETLLLAGSLPLLWAWFLSWQASYKTPGGHLQPWWHVMLVVDGLLLVLLLVRRFRRVRQALRELEVTSMHRGGPPLNGKAH